MLKKPSASVPQRRKHRLGGRGRSGEATAAAAATASAVTADEEKESTGAHGETDQSEDGDVDSGSAAAVVRCKLFVRGKCRKGSRCKFLHERPPRNAVDGQKNVDTEAVDAGDGTPEDDGERHAARQRRKRNALSSGKKTADGPSHDSLLAVIDQVNTQIDTEVSVQRQRARSKQEWKDTRVRAKEEAKSEKKRRRDELVEKLRMEQNRQKKLQKNGGPRAQKRARTMPQTSASDAGRTKSVRFA